MKRASVATLKARLSEYLATVKAGEEVIVTERGRPIARLAPVSAAHRADARMQHLIRAGLVRPPVKALPADFFKRPRPKDPEGLILAALLEDRAEGR